MAKAKTATVAAPKATTTAPKSELTGRPILYPKITVNGHEIPMEDLLQTAEDAKVMLGWETESEHEARLTEGLSPERAAKMDVQYKNDYDLIDYNGEKVKLNNNTRNRPLDPKWMQQLGKDMLSSYWRFNGESWIIGQTGLALSLQHRALALIWAQQMIDYEGDDEDKLEVAKKLKAEFGDKPLAIPAIVVRGIEESPDVTRTLDNVRPRSLADVLFADTSLFNQTAKADREKLCRYVDYAIRTIQKRTGENLDAFAPRRSHSEPLEFLSRHPRLLKAVQYIFTEVNRKDAGGEKPSVLEEYVAPGTAAGLMFLMGSSLSDRERWDAADTPNDRHLNFDRWEQAELFWSGLGDAKNGDFNAVRQTIAKCGNAQTGSTAPVAVRVAVIVNAWNEYVDENGVMSQKNIMPEFGEMDDHGNRALVGHPSVGGIDLGDAKKVWAEEEEEAAAAAAAAEEAATKAREAAKAKAAEENAKKAQAGPSAKEKAEIEKRKAEVKAQSIEAKVNGTPATGTPKKGGLRGGVGK